MDELNEIEVRRLHISDEQWERTSPSWKELRPFRDFNYFLNPESETEEAYFARLNAAGFQIPRLVLDQWLYGLYYDCHTVDNYGWIDYRKARFSETTLSTEALTQLYVIKDFRDLVQQRAKAEPFKNFACIPKDVEYWKRHGTWRVPPIVIDATSFQTAPAYAELVGPMQLIEGHNRLGYLHALVLADIMPASEHKVFLLRRSE